MAPAVLRRGGSFLKYDYEKLSAFDSCCCCRSHCRGAAARAGWRCRMESTSLSLPQRRDIA